jgi:hypothetical protein
MSFIRGFGIPFSRRIIAPEPKIAHVLTQRPLHRVLKFTGCTIDDVVNNPIAKNQVLGYYKLHRFVERRSEVIELERQWNPLA